MRMAANAKNAKISTGQGQRATDATMPTRIAAKPSHSANRPGRSASTTNRASARQYQTQETSEPLIIAFHAFDQDRQSRQHPQNSRPLPQQPVNTPRE